ncbi:MAG: hypothetical protein O9282_02875 [Flavobacterium sp.]|jgi:hypothetical protein|uniref:hypothetical protein n=1 Tax=Flavobacterium sp. TaxID=239 RepID=UPI0022C1B5C2|nr:hypothetical protein [Flavobacterium sp.]MCZ8330236.1 hypothetical protein [Flavobacterium sp.]
MKQMQKKTKRRLVVQYFLRKMQQIMEADKVNSVDAVWLNIYTKDELMDIIRWAYAPTVPQWITYEQMSEQELLDAIGDDFYILAYEIEQTRLELHQTMKVTPKRVFDTLVQLGLETHYLMQKPIAEWDEYDSANYRALSHKAGNPTPLFGIYDSAVKEEDKYFVTTPPPKFFNTEREAMDTLAELIKSGQLKEGEAKVMML